MNTTNKLKEIRKRIIEANPKHKEACKDLDMTETMDYLASLKFGLCDVLLAIENDVSTGNLGELFKEICCNWNLKNDSLDWHAEHQPEILSFLHDILCPK